MGSVKQVSLPARDKEYVRNVLESDSSRSAMLKRESAMKDLEMASKFLKMTELQNLEVESQQLKDQLTKPDSALSNKLNGLAADIFHVRQDLKPGNQTHSKQVDLSQDVMWDERYKLVARSLENLRNGKSKADKTIPSELDANSRYTQLKERFTSLNLNLTKDVPDDFKICIDCKHFKSNELKVIVKDDCVLVQGNHDVKLDDHGLVKREFNRRWFIPEDVKQEKFSCLLDRYGILTIRAPRKVSSTTVPIQSEKSNEMAFLEN